MGNPNPNRFHAFFSCFFFWPVFIYKLLLTFCLCRNITVTSPYTARLAKAGCEYDCMMSPLIVTSGGPVAIPTTLRQHFDASHTLECNGLITVFFDASDWLVWTWVMLTSIHSAACHFYLALLFWSFNVRPECTIYLSVWGRYTINCDILQSKMHKSATLKWQDACDG